MPISDLLGRRARTGSGVEVSAPTVRTFFRALEVYGVEIGLVREASRSVPGGIGVDVAVSLFVATPEDGRLEYVIGTSDTAAARLFAEMVVPLAARIDALLSPPDAEIVEDDVIDGPTALILGFAERFKIDPMAVLDWPLGLFLDARLALTRPPKRDAQMDAIKSMVADTPERTPIIGGPERASVS